MACVTPVWALFPSLNFPDLLDHFTFNSGSAAVEEAQAPGTTVTKVEKMGTPFDDMFDDSGFGSSLTSSFGSPFTSWSPFAPAYSTYQSTTRTVMGADGPQTVKTEVNYDPTTKEKTTTTTWL